MSLTLHGTYTALVTPFTKDAPHAVEWGRLEELVGAQIEGGVSGLVPCGTTGESPTLSHAEQREIIERVVKRSAGRVQVIAGTGTNSTEAAIELSREAEKAGASGVM